MSTMPKPDSFDLFAFKAIALITITLAGIIAISMMLIRQVV